MLLFCAVHGNWISQQADGDGVRQQTAAACCRQQSWRHQDVFFLLLLRLHERRIAALQAVLE